MGYVPNDFTKIGGHSGYSGSSGYSGYSGYSGIVYCQQRCINTGIQTTSILNSSIKYSGGVLKSNGDIHFIPNSKKILQKELLFKKLEPKPYKTPSISDLDPNFEKTVLGFFRFFHKLFKTKKYQELHKKLW